MPIEDIFSITGRGTVATGRVEQGIVNTGDEVEIVGITDTTKTVVTGVEMFRKILDQGQAGDNIGALLRGTKREEIERGQVLCKPGSITPHTKFKAEVYCLKKEEGGRHTPFFSGYRPQFYFRTTDVTGIANLPEGTEMVMPGDNVEMTHRADPADRHGPGPALRDSRGRPDRGVGGRLRGHRVGPRGGPSTPPPRRHPAAGQLQKNIRPGRRPTKQGRRPFHAVKGRTKRKGTENELWRRLRRRKFESG